MRIFASAQVIILAPKPARSEIIATLAIIAAVISLIQNIVGLFARSAAQRAAALQQQAIFELLYAINNNLIAINRGVEEILARVEKLPDEFRGILVANDAENDLAQIQGAYQNFRSARVFFGNRPNYSKDVEQIANYVMTIRQKREIISSTSARLRQLPPDASLIRPAAERAKRIGEQARSAEDAASEEEIKSTIRNLVRARASAEAAATAAHDLLVSAQASAARAEQLQRVADVLGIANNVIQLSSAVAGANKGGNGAPAQAVKQSAEKFQERERIQLDIEVRLIQAIRFVHPKVSDFPPIPQTSLS